MTVAIGADCLARPFEYMGCLCFGRNRASHQGLHALVAIIKDMFNKRTLFGRDYNAQFYRNLRIRILNIWKRWTDTSLCRSFVLFMSCVLCLGFVVLSRLFIAALWSPAGKGPTSWLLFVMSNCAFVTFPCGILGQVWYLIVSSLDLWRCSYFFIPKILMTLHYVLAILMMLSMLTTFS